MTQGDGRSIARVADTCNPEAARLHPWLVFAGSALALGIAATSRVPWRPDEHRYIEVARQMVATGNWLVPHLNGSVYAHKPPGFFWSVASAHSAGIPLELAGMLPSVLGASATLALTFALARRAFDSGTAWTAVTLLASLELFSSLAVRANVDALLAASTTAACYGVWRALELERTARRARLGWIFAVGLITGLGALVKGPVASVFPAATLVVLIGLARGRTACRVADLAVAAGGLALPLSLWLGAAALAGGPAYVHELVWGHGVGHALGRVDKLRPIWFYLLDFPGSLLPWVVLLPAVLLWLRRGASERGTVFALAWLTGSFVVMSLFPAKRHLYLLPLCPAAALVGARLIHAPHPDGIRFRIAWHTARVSIGGISGSLGFALIVAFTLGALGLDVAIARSWPAWALVRGEVAQGAVPGFALIASSLLLVGAWCVLQPHRTHQTIRGVRAIGLGIAACFVGVLHPIDAIGRSPSAFYQRIDALVGNDSIGFYGRSDFAPNWLLDRDEVPMLANQDVARAYLQDHRAPTWLVAEESSLTRLGTPAAADRVLSIPRGFASPMVLLRWSTPGG